MAVGWTVGAVVFFYAQWTSGFDRVMGNAGDSRLIVYLNEHWYHVLRGGQAWLDPAFYYPTRGVLGYSDTFFLWQVFYAPLRLLGAEPFLSFQLTIVAMSLLGFVTFVAFVRAAFGTPVPLGVAGAMVFVFASNLAAHAGSPQVFGIYVAPSIALLGLRAWRLRTVRPRSSVGLAFAAGLLAALLLFSTYYVGWFTLLGAGLVAVLALVVAPRRAVGDVAGAFRTGWRSLGAGCIGFGLGLVPFLETFLPVIHQLGVRRYGDALYFAPRSARPGQRGERQRPLGRPHGPPAARLLDRHLRDHLRGDPGPAADRHGRGVRPGLGPDHGPGPGDRAPPATSVGIKSTKS